VILSYGADTGIIHVPSAAARASEICQDPAGQLVHEKPVFVRLVLSSLFLKQQITTLSPHLHSCCEQAFTDYQPDYI